jgi:hypothetical protein
MHPRPDVPPSVRKLPARKTIEAPRLRLDAEQTALPSPAVVAPPRPAFVAPLAPERYQITCTVSRGTHDKLRQVQDLLRHAIPKGDLDALLDRALTVLLAELSRTKLATTPRPRAGRTAKTGSRHIPAAVRRAVWARDEARCAFVGAHGRCSETGFLEFHHVVPFAVGGAADVEGIQLRCAAHNKYEAEQYFGTGQPWLVREGCGPWSVEPSVHHSPVDAKGRQPGSRASGERPYVRRSCLDSVLFDSAGSQLGPAPVEQPGR